MSADLRDAEPENVRLGGRNGLRMARNAALVSCAEYSPCGVVSSLCEALLQKVM